MDSWLKMGSSKSLEEAPTKEVAPKKSLLKRPLFLLLLAAVIVAIIIAIVVPLAIILPKKHHHTAKATILIPLYIYPTNTSSWSPLYDALEAHPDLNFTIIINPSSGPGSSQYPDEQYASSLQKLNGYANAYSVGYVRTGYGTRNISDVLSEVDTYAGWASKSSLLAMNGIFFDESPHVYNASAVTFMQTANAAVKASTGLQRQKTIIHNPGTVPDAAYAINSTDITVIFEESYTTYQSKLTSLEALPKLRSSYSIMVHDVPTMTMSSLRDYVKQLSSIAEFLFVTDSNENYYESFADQWANFTSVVPT